MLKSEKNAFYEALAAGGIDLTLLPHESVDPEEFDVSGLLQPGIRVRLVDSDLWFAFFKAEVAETAKHAWFACRCNDYSYITEAILPDKWLRLGGNSGSSLTWGNGPAVPIAPIEPSAIALTEWLQRVVPPYLEERGRPDLWEKRAVTDAVRQIAPGVGADPFTSQEVENLRRAIVELQEYVYATFNLSGAQQSFVASRLAALEGHLRTMDKMTWTTFAVGTIISIASGLFLTNEEGRQLVDRAKDLINAALKFLT